MRSIVIATLLAATAAVPAFAQDSASTSNSTFTGPRVEAFIGGDQLKSLGHDNGFVYGAGAGYDVQVQGPRGPIFGIEAEVSNAAGTRQCNGATTVASPRLCNKAGRDFYVGGRVGAPVVPNLLLYGKAGYVNTRLTRSSNTGAGAVVFDKSNYGGWRLGAGAEYALSPKMFVKTEYRFTDYEGGFSRHQVVGGFGLRF